MTREEAIQILSTRDAHGVLCGYTSGVTEALDMAIEALSADAEWIPCSERLPSESDYYLVTNINAFEEKEVCVIWFAHKTDYGVSEWRETTDEDTILAWMPLPKPYKGGDAE